ncbi:MAG: flagellar hook-basal body complex protein [Candidatus Saganbacteria bacterium]|nr:flagellar hook-basal body complex protein [Candidatus Saganbacteria bacterium]
MLDIMSQAQNAIEAYNQALTASSANIANMDVSGYKKISVSFESVFAKVLSQGSAAQTNIGGTNPLQFGSGMSISGTTVDFSNGEYATGGSLDLAIAGSGLFIVSPDGGNTFLYTRAGNFRIDSNNNLTSNNLQVYGLDSGGNLVPISSLPSGNTTNFRWQQDGTLQYTSDPTAATPAYVNTGYSIALTYFANPGGLAQAQGTSFAATLASGQAATAQGPGGGAGTVKPGQIEQSNVFFLGESVQSLEIQRAISANLSIVKLASDTISSFIQKLG